jgi:hypothetical protein
VTEERNFLALTGKALFKFVQIYFSLDSLEETDHIIFLIWAMAKPGFKPFGHVFEQFMIV